MEEFLLHHCVTSDAKAAEDGDRPSLWQSSGRAESVLVQENRQANGISRVMLSAVLRLVVQSSKTTKVLLLTLDSPQVARGLEASAKFTHVDYSADADTFQSSTSSSQLLIKMVRNIESVEAEVALAGATSARPMVVVLDSLNALLQQTSLQQVLQFLRQLRSHAVVGSVVVRLNAGAESPAVAQALAAQATALVLVETRSSLRSYPLLAKERRREIPQGMHGLVLLVRQKKNGRSSEGMEFFHVQGDKLMFVAANASVPSPTPNSKDTSSTAAQLGARKSQSDAKPSPVGHPIQLERSGQAPLPVPQEDVSFNLSISAAEQRAKSQVQLPYMHQGVGTGPASKGGDAGSTAGSNALFFIDEDDPDWDDDDVDDDLDI